MTREGEALGLFARWTRHIEDGVLITLLVGMIVLATGQIVARNLFDTGLVWADEALRLLVLWVAMAGAVVASRDRNHVTIDVLSRYLPPRPRLAVSILVDLFVVAVSSLIAWHALAFVQMTREWGDMVLTSLPAVVSRLFGEENGGVPAWMAQVVLPAGFAVIAVRYLRFATVDLLELVRLKTPVPPAESSS